MNNDQIDRMEIFAMFQTGLDLRTAPNMKT